MHYFVLLLLWSFSTFLLVPANAADFESTNPAGTYPVGFERVQHSDHTRVFHPQFDIVSGKAFTGERSRPVQMLVWYPAATSNSSTASRLTYDDYVRLRLTEDNFALSTVQIDKLYQREIADLQKRMGDPKRAEQLLDKPMNASRGLPPAAGKFPVVVYAASYSNTADENSDLCEWLASHGYLVIAVPSMGPTSHKMTHDIEGLEQQAGDISVAIAYAQKHPLSDMSQIAVMGYSRGGLSNFLAAAKDDRIRALIALEGSVRYDPKRVNGGKDAVPYVTPARVAIPLLYAAAQPPDIEEIVQNLEPSYSFMNEMKYADVYRMTLYPLTHGDFASKYLRESDPANYKDYSLDEITRANNTMYMYILNFLNARLKQDAQSELFLSREPRDNGVPARTLSMTIIRAKAKAPTFESFASDLHQRGFSHAQTVFEERKKQDDKFQLSKEALNSWGYQLLRNDRVKEAIEVFKLNAFIYPNDANTFDSLAEAYAKDKNKALAILNYKKSLQLNPDNIKAAKQIELLSK